MSCSVLLRSVLFNLWCVLDLKTDGQLDAAAAVCNQSNSAVKLAGGTSNMSTHKTRHHSLLLLSLSVCLSVWRSLSVCLSLSLVPEGSSLRDEDVAVYAFDINQPSLPTPVYSVLVSVFVFMVLTTVFYSIHSPDNSPLFHPVLSVFMKVSLSPEIILCD